MYVIYIANNCNMNGPKSARISDISSLLARGVHVKIDVYYTNNTWYISTPNNSQNIAIDTQILMHPHTWCQAKDYVGYLKMVQMGVNCFWQDSDKLSLTQRGFIWARSNFDLVNIPPDLLDKIICNTTSQWITDKQRTCYGICSDYTERFMSEL